MTSRKRSHGTRHVAEALRLAQTVRNCQLPQGPYRSLGEGRLSEKASDRPEPAALARSQSFFVAASLSFAWKIPAEFDLILATVRHRPCVPWRR